MDCYKRNWNDYVIALNQASAEYAAAVGAVANTLDTHSFQTPVAVANPLQFPRKESIFAALPAAHGKVCVCDGEGNELPLTCTDNGVYFTAQLAPLSVTVFDIKQQAPAAAFAASLTVTEHSLENSLLRAELDANGDICSVFDKTLNRELLSAPAAFDIIEYDGVYSYPAWEFDYAQSNAAPARRTALVSVQVYEQGGSRASIRVVKRDGDSVFTQIITLEQGSRMLKVYNEADWRSFTTLLKARFPLTAKSDGALYDLGLGFIKRPVNTKKRFEVPAQMWAATADAAGDFYCAVLSDSRTGWDMPAQGVLRLTCMHSPRHRYREESAQHMLDFGLNRFGFAICAADNIADIQRMALCFNSPAASFLTDCHNGGSYSVSLADISGQGVLLRAFKKAEQSDELVIRLNEGAGKPQGTAVTLPADVISAREINASEQQITAVDAKDNTVKALIEPFGLKSYALKLKATQPAPCEGTRINLGADIEYTSPNCSAHGCPELNGFTLPAELMPQSLLCAGVEFALNGTATLCRGQTISLAQDAGYIYILAACTKGDTRAVFDCAGTQIQLEICDMYENIGAWDLYAQGITGYIKQSTLGHVFTHIHSDSGDVRGKLAYMFRYRLPVNGTRLTLPYNPDIVIFAATATQRAVSEPLCPMYDTLEKRECDFILSEQKDRQLQITKLQGKKGRLHFIKGYAVRQLARERAMGLSFRIKRR